MLYEIFLFNRQSYKKIKLHERNKATTDCSRQILISKKSLVLSLLHLFRRFWAFVLADFPYFPFFMLTCLTDTRSVILNWSSHYLFSLSQGCGYSKQHIWYLQLLKCHTFITTLSVTGKQEFRPAFSILALMLQNMMFSYCSLDDFSLCNTTLLPFFPVFLTKYRWFLVTVKVFPMPASTSLSSIKWLILQSSS